MKALITGLTGFAGSHLAELLLKENVEVFGTKRVRSRMENIEKIESDIKLYDCDLMDPISIKRVLKSVMPDYVFHLAAQSFVKSSWTDPSYTMTCNIIGQLNLFEALVDLNINPMIQIAVSSEEYGMVEPNEIPIHENVPLRPLSPYAVSKVAQDVMGYQYWKSYGLNIIRTRAFNHSVSKWTPVLIRDDRSGLIDIKYISEIRSKQKKGGYLSGKLDGDVQIWDMYRSNISVWSDDGFQKIKTIHCHPIRDNKLFKIATRQSVYDVTDNHSILNEDGSDMHAGECKVGDSLLLSELPEVKETEIPLELAWFYGFFAAEGCCKISSVNVDNNDLKLIEKSERIVKKYLCHESRKYFSSNDKTIRLILSRSKKYSNMFRELFYASDKNKKVPRIILNAEENVKLEFLRGFNDGDGLKGGYNSDDEFKSFKTKSPILAMGLCFLIENTTKQRYTICIEDRDGKYYYAINLNSRYNKNLGNHLIKKSNEVVKKIDMEYTDEVWDIETENNHFHCGIGKGIVHNSGPRRGEVFATSTFAKQVASIEKGLQKPVIKHGNLDAVRDLTDVRDTVRAYYILLQQGKPGEVYNICSGNDWTMQKVMDYLISLSNVEVTKEIDPERLRPSDLPVLIGCNKKLKSETNWNNTIALEQTLEDLLNYWRDRLEK